MLRRSCWDNCQGTQTFPDGDKYVGEYKNNKFSGQGTTRSPMGAKYVGQYKDDKKNGQGTLTLANGVKYVGEFKGGKFVRTATSAATARRRTII
jgi:hypothetical protein